MDFLRLLHNAVTSPASPRLQLISAVASRTMSDRGSAQTRMSVTSSVDTVFRQKEECKVCCLGRPAVCRFVFAILLWSSWQLQVVTSQVIEPGPNPKVYLPERCDGFAVNGLHTGVIYSHSASDNYTPNTDCTVLFSIHADYVMKFTFEHFELQTQVRGKCEDYVQFFAGHSLEMTLTEQFCGHKIPGQIMTNSSRVALRFRTNGALQGSGFRVRFKRTKISNLQCQSGDCPGFLAVPRQDSSQPASNTAPTIATSGPAVLLLVLGVLVMILLRGS